MQIYAKSKLTQNIYDKIEKGADGIEIHLDVDYETSFKTLNGHFVKDIPIRAVHVPFIAYEDGSRIDTCVDHKRSWPILEKTMDFAQKIAEKKGWSIVVIAHLASNVEELKLYGIYDDIVDFLKEIIEKYPNVELAIENSTKRGHLNYNMVFRSICYNDPTILVKDIDHERIGTCLDTCHAMMDIKMMKLLESFLGIEKVSYENLVTLQKMREYFEINKDVCKWIHLANIEEHGSGKDHGKPFKKKHKKKLRKIIDLYEEFEYTCPITIEVQEEDYSDAVNFAKTKETLETVLFEKELDKVKSAEKAQRKEKREIKAFVDSVRESLDESESDAITTEERGQEQDGVLVQQNFGDEASKEENLEANFKEKVPGHQILIEQDKKLREAWNVDKLKEENTNENKES